MNLLDYLLLKYGPLLDMDELAEVLKTTKRTLENRRYTGQLEIPTYKAGAARVVSAEIVAGYLVGLAETAEAHEQVRWRDKLDSMRGESLSTAEAECMVAAVTTIEDLRLHGRVENILNRKGINTILDLTARTRSELVAFAGIDSSRLKHIEGQLKRFGLRLAGVPA